MQKQKVTILFENSTHVKYVKYRIKEKEKFFFLKEETAGIKYLVYSKNSKHNQRKKKKVAMDSLTKKDYKDEVLIYDAVHYECSLKCIDCKNNVIERPHNKHKCLYMCTNISLLFLTTIANLFDNKQISERSRLEWTKRFL